MQTAQTNFVMSMYANTRKRYEANVARMLNEIARTNPESLPPDDPRHPKNAVRPAPPTPPAAPAPPTPPAPQPPPQAEPAAPPSDSAHQTAATNHEPLTTNSVGQSTDHQPLTTDSAPNSSPIMEPMPLGTGKKVVVAMSGGVDSSVAAALLKQDGYEVLGCFMRLGSPKGVELAEVEAAHEADCKVDPTAPPAKQKQGCCSVLDAADARRVAGLLDVPFYVLNFQDDFSKVIDYFTAEYNAGRTPNPCVRCNDWLKFGKLADYAKAVGADFVASGHYARMGTDPRTGLRILMRGKDHKKDQSYVLFGMSRGAMEHTLLPIGEYEKHEVRKIAQELKLPTFNKPDSQEICFVPNQDYAGLLKRREPGAFKEGEFTDMAGKPMGKHEGHQHFTIGQRKGLGISNVTPLYVIDINSQSGRVTLGPKEALLHRSLMAGQINVLREGLRPGEAVKVQAKIRYNSDPQPARLTLLPSEGAGGTHQTGAQMRVDFDEPQSAITPGQAVVCYDGECVVAGGWISQTLDAAKSELTQAAQAASG